MELPVAQYLSLYPDNRLPGSSKPKKLFMRPTNFTSLSILLLAVLLMVLNQTLLADQIPSWIFIVLLALWLIVKVRTIRNMRK